MDEWRREHWRSLPALRRTEVPLVTGLSASTVDRRIKDETLRTVRVGRTVLVSVPSVRQMLGEIVEPGAATKRAARLTREVRGLLEEVGC